MSKRYYVISEYGYIGSRKYASLADKGSAIVEDKVFQELESFILKNKDGFEESVSGDFLSISYKKGTGKILKAQNYVGLIQTKSGTTIEILPKIYESGREASYDKTIKIFLRMLKYLKDSPFKKFNLSSVDTRKMNLLDIFINMFLEELVVLLKKGLKSKYISEEGNLDYYKGKLNVNKHLMKNMVNKQRFYVNYDEYSIKRPENKLIKSTLLLLKGKTDKSSLQNSIRRYLFMLDEITPSKDIKNDFAKCSNNRIMSEYDSILSWCRIFLDNKSFVNFKGDSTAYSLLFPMEKVFESYVAKLIKNYEGFSNFNVYTQHNKYFLLKKPKMFRLRPDIVMENEEKVIILDTKWKLLNGDPTMHYGISQGDLYQMYAYANKYKSKDIILLYPKSSMIYDIESKDICFYYDDEIKVRIFFIDLEETGKSIERLDNVIFDKIHANIDDELSQ